jgi:hypothetical protein
MQKRLIAIIKQLMFIADSAILVRYCKDLDKSIDWETVQKLLVSIKDELKQIESN